MPRKKDKAHIIQRLEMERRRLEANLARLSQADMLQPGVVQQWTVKDVLAHLCDWENRFPIWLEAGRQGAPADCPDPNYTWKQIHQLNAHIYQVHRDQPVEDVLAEFHRAHQQFMQAVESLSEDELFTPSYYPFTETASILDWLYGFANHDLWGKTKIRQWLKAQGR